MRKLSKTQNDLLRRDGLQLGGRERDERKRVAGFLPDKLVSIESIKEEKHGHDNNVSHCCEKAVVTALIREKLLICAMDESWFVCVYFHCLLLINMHAQPCPFILYSLHVIYRETNQVREHVLLQGWEGTRMSFLSSTGEPLFCFHFQEVT